MLEIIKYYCCLCVIWLVKKLTHQVSPLFHLNFEVNCKDKNQYANSNNLTTALL